LDKPSYLLFVGSAGSYGRYEIFDIVESNGAANVELSFLQNKSYAPIDNVIVSQFEGVSHETIINTSNYITTDFELAQEFRKHKIGLENMEFFSVLRVAQEFNIPAAGIFVVTNYCNETAHDDFLKNHKKAIEKLDAYLRKNIVKPKN
jgi:nucleoside phosphorylase